MVSLMLVPEKKWWNQGHIRVPGCGEVLIQSRVSKSAWFFDFAVRTFLVWLSRLMALTCWGPKLSVRSEGCGDAKAPREWHAEGQTAAEKTWQLVITCHRMSPYVCFRLCQTRTNAKITVSLIGFYSFILCLVMECAGLKLRYWDPWYGQCVDICFGLTSLPAGFRIALDTVGIICLNDRFTTGS